MIKKYTRAQSMSQPQFPQLYFDPTTLHLSRTQQQLFIHFNLYYWTFQVGDNKREFSRDDFDEWRRQGYILIQNLFLRSKSGPNNVNTHLIWKFHYDIHPKNVHLCGDVFNVCPFFVVCALFTLFMFVRVFIEV